MGNSISALVKAWPNGSPIAHGPERSRPSSPSGALCECATSAFDLSHANFNKNPAELFDRFCQTSDPGTFSASVEASHALLEHSTEDQPADLKRRHVLIQLSRAFCARYRYLRDQQDLERALDFAREVLGNSASAAVTCPLVLVIYGDVLELHAEYHGSAEERDIAERLEREALSLLSVDHPLRPACLRNLGMVLHRRFQVTSSSEYLDEALRLQRDAATDAALVCADERHHHLSILGQHLWVRHMVAGDSNDLEEAVPLLREAVNLCPSSHIERETVLFRLSQGLHCRYRIKGELGDLEEALNVAKQALSKSMPGSSSRGYAIEAIATNLTERVFVASTVAADLDELVLLRREAHRINVLGQHSGWIEAENLANALRLRYLWSGDPADLEEAIELRRHALESRTDTNPHGWMTTGNRAADLYLRYKEYKRLDDLTEAIHPYRVVSQSTSVANPQHYDQYLSFAAALCTSAEALSQVSDLDEAIDFLTRVMELIPSGHRFIQRFVSRLATALILRFERMSSLADLETSMQLLQQYTDGSFLGSYSGVEYRQVTCKAHMARYRAYRNTEDANAALAIQRDLLDRTVLGRVDRHECFLEAARLYLEPGTPFRDITIALQHLAEALADEHRDVRSRIQGAVRLLQIVEARHVVNTAGDAVVREQLVDIYASLVALLPRIAYFGVDLSSRLSALAVGQSVATTGSSHALHVHQTERAVEILEQGRAIFWTHALRLRSEFDTVPERYRDQLLLLAQQLERDTDISYGSADRKVVERAMVLRRKQSDTFASLIDQVRVLPGLDRFMLHDEYSLLAKAADKGPLVMLVSSAGAGYAIIIRTSRAPLSVSLPELTDAWVLDASSTWGSAVSQARSAVRERLHLAKVPIVSKSSVRANAAREILEGLWAKVTKPVLLALGLKQSSGRLRPRVWWCPTGSTVHLPIHAAGTREESCSDYVVSSYIPTLGSLINARNNFEPVSKADIKTLLAAVPRPYAERWRDLISTPEEIRAVAEIMPSSAIIPLPPNENAMIDESNGLRARTLLDKLPGATILHLACHGLQDPENPLKSGFVMRDELVTIERLMPTPLPRAFLAFLSACETAKGDKVRTRFLARSTWDLNHASIFQDQPDQTIHLAATMLFAGFKSVIATLWSMEDIDGPMIARKVYADLFNDERGYLDPDDVPYALDAAVQELRRVYPEPSRWASYIHIGM